MQIPRRRDRRLPGWTLTVLATLLVATLATRSLAAPDADPAAAIDGLRSAIEESALDETQREAVAGQLDTAAANLDAAAELRQRLASLRAEVAARPGDDALAVDTDQAFDEWVARLSSDVDVETLENVLQQQRAIVSERAVDIERRSAELAQVLARPSELSSEITALRRRADELSAPVEAAEGTPPLLQEARALQRATELRRVQAELELRRAEQATNLERQRLREAQLRGLREQQELDRERSEWLRTRIAERAREELELAVARLVGPEPDPDAPGDDRPRVVASLAEENRALGAELLEQNDELAKDRRAVAREEQAAARVSTALRESRTRLALGGANAAVGRWLWSERRRLEKTSRIEQWVADRRSELAELRLRRVTLSEAQRELDDIPDAAEALRDSVQKRAEDEGRTVAAEERIEPLLRHRLELMDRLEPILQRRVEALEQSELALQSQLETTREMRQLLDRHLLWTPSHAAIDATWLERAPEGLSDLVKVSRWATTLRLTKEEILDRPFLWTGCLLLLGVLIELRRRAPARIRAQAELTRRIETDDIGVSLVAFGWTLLAALPGPVALGLVGTLLQTVGNPGRYSDSLGRALSMLVLPLLVVQVLRWSVIEDGLGHAHFLWTEARRSALRRILTPAAAIVLPMYFVNTLAFVRNLDLPNDVQARTAVVIACAALAWAFWRLLGIGQVWVRRGAESEPSSLRRLLRVAFPSSAFVVAVLALAGFVFSAGLLLRVFLMSICLVVAVSLGLGLLGRWFLIGERRLAARRRDEHRAGEASADAESSDEGGKAELTLDQINAQTQRLLMVLRVGLLFFGLLGVWAEVLPAVTRLDEIAVWTFADVAPDGTPLERPVTLMGALFGLVALVLTIVGSRNLPGLVELGLLSQTNIDAASRYAVTSLLRYAIVITGTLVGLQMLGMRWSQLQWLAAALTVGLGFGLQEIFANFVSGLILLFERPFRVGDVISVGDLTGRVTRIRTRATTILDFDNREIVVPNKNFITGQLLNWTLSDSMTRIIIKVGVAYGTDPDEVHRLLMRAATEHPLVQSEPEPCSWFLAFGASSLDFELRVFVGALGDRLQVQSELHREIARLFAEHDIEIAFPQMDLHVRDMPDGGAASTSASQEPRAAGGPSTDGEKGDA